MSNRTTTREELGEEWGRDVWAAGEYSCVATQYLPMAARLADVVGIDANDRVLDIGTGTGNLAITAARSGATVTGLDICDDLVQRARDRADAVGLDTIAFDVGDAADLPYAENAFDIAVSNLGHMYADPPSAAARELIRVTRPGGRIGFTSWTPMSLYPRLAGVAVQHVPFSALPNYSEPPFMWGDEDTVRDRLAGDVAALTAESAQIRYPAVAPTAFWEETKQTSGMFKKLVSSLDRDETQRMDSEMISVIDSVFDGSSNTVPLLYLQTVATVENG